MTDMALKIRWYSEEDEATGCWNWKKGVNINGYGDLYYKGRTHRAHRVSYEVNVGPIPDGLLVCHKCDNRACVNPDHLFVGTNADNLGDMAAKGRHKPCKGMKHGRAKLTDADVYAIRASRGLSHSTLAKMYGVSPTAIHGVLVGKYWKHLLKPLSPAPSEARS